MQDTNMTHMHRMSKIRKLNFPYFIMGFNDVQEKEVQSLTERESTREARPGCHVLVLQFHKDLHVPSSSAEGTVGHPSRSPCPQS